MQGIIKYIDQNFPGCQFSQIIYQQSIANAGIDTRVDVSYSAQKAIAILYHYFYTIGTPEAVVFDMTVQDQFLLSLFHINRGSPGANSICFPIPYLQQGSRVNIKIPSNGGVLIHFAISFQYLFNLPPKQ